MSYILSKSPAYKASCQFHIPSDGVIVEQPYEWGIPLKLRFCVVWRLGQESIFYILFRQIKFSNAVAREKKQGSFFHDVDTKRARTGGRNALVTVTLTYFHLRTTARRKGEASSVSHG
jgi:hypothetical protein